MKRGPFHGIFQTKDRKRISQLLEKFYANSTVKALELHNYLQDSINEIVSLQSQYFTFKCSDI